MQNHIEQRTVDLQRAFRTAGVVNKSQLPEPVHEEADPRARGPNHLGQSFLTDFWYYSLRNAFLAEVSEQ